MKTLLLIGCLFISGCATIPKNAILVNAEIGRGIGSGKISHLQSIDDWAYERRQKAEVVLKYYWTRKYIITFFKGKNAKADLKKIGRAGSVGETEAAIIQEMVEYISRAVERERRLVFDQIDKEHRILKDKVLQHFTELEANQRTITANIQSVVSDQKFNKALRDELAKPLKRIAPIDKVTKGLDKFFDEEKNETLEKWKSKLQKKETVK